MGRLRVHAPCESGVLGDGAGAGADPGAGGGGEGGAGGGGGCWPGRWLEGGEGCARADVEGFEGVGGFG